MIELLPAHGPRASMYSFISGASVETDPASARPKPSSIDFLPRAITSSGMSSYRVLTMNSET